MSTDSHTTPAGKSIAQGPHSEFAVGPQSSEGRSRDAINEQLVRETRNQIRSLVDEVTQLAESNCAPEEFYQGFLTRTTAALASVGGAVWRIGDGGPVQLEYHVNLAEMGIGADTPGGQRHSKLLEQVIQTGQPTLIPPGSGTEQADGAGNPTEHLLIIGPLTIDGSVVGLLEIFQRSGAGPTTQRGYLRFVNQMCKVASDFLKNNQLRSFSEQQSAWTRLKTFVRTVHASLDTRQTVFAIANEGRRVIDCDRVSVALRNGSQLQVQAVSGLDTIERRANQIKQLGRLATSVARAGQPLWYTGDDSDLPPQIEQQLHEYLDIAHTKLLVVQPLRERAPHVDGDDATAQSAPSGPVIGALIVEQMADDRITTSLRERLETVSSHSSDALTNSLTHSQMFLAPLWSWIGKTRAVTQARNMPRTLVAAGLLAAALAALWLVPAKFALNASGKLTPQRQSEIFAAVDGVLQQILVPDDPDQLVEPNQVLAVMTNNDLMVEIQNLQGRLQQAQEKVKKLQRAQASRMNALEHRLIEGDLAEALEEQESLGRQLQLKLHQAELLNVRAPTRGRVVNWQLRNHLLRRPVQRGQNLMTIVDPDTPWQIELEFPERGVAHLMNAMDESDQPLEVAFTLASHPGREFAGRLLSVDNKLDVRSDSGNAVLVRVEFDEQHVPRELLRSGTRVTAQIDAGTCSLGYAWFHEIIETVHSTWLMWF